MRLAISLALLLLPLHRHLLAQSRSCSLARYLISGGHLLIELVPLPRRAWRPVAAVLRLAHTKDRSGDRCGTAIDYDQDHSKRETRFGAARPNRVKRTLVAKSFSSSRWHGLCVSLAHESGRNEITTSCSLSLSL